jgi:DNA-binding response OmpR family regulator
MAKTILLADDSPTIRKIVELTFSGSDLRIEAVGSGEEALRLLDEVEIDLVLADVVMPEPSGYEICRAVKSSPRPVPVLLLAGTFEPFDAELAERCGADGQLTKPFEASTLRNRVEALLAPAEPGSGPSEPVSAAEHDIEEAMDEAADRAPEGDEAVEASGRVAAEPSGSAEGFMEEHLPEPSAALVEAVSREVVKRLSDEVLREIAWEVVPDLAAKIIRERIRELEREDPGTR